MNFLKKLLLPGCAALLSAMVFSGCTNSPDPVFTDNPTPPAMSGSLSNDTESAAALFRIGETVVVASNTGSDSDPGPMAAAGQNFLIADNGTITLPLVGSIQAAGLTPGQLQEAIAKLYVPQYFVHLTITVTAMNRVYYVGGEVAHPGPEVYIGSTTVTTAVQAAGDLTQFGSHRVWLTRADGTRIKVNLDKALSDSTQDPPVFPGDKIQVPRRLF
jgi:polysaccharide export outer membrane protein